MANYHRDGGCEVVDLLARRRALAPPPGSFCDLRVGDTVDRKGIEGEIVGFKMTAFERDIFDVAWEDGRSGSASHVQLRRVGRFFGPRPAPAGDTGDEAPAPFRP